MDLRPDLDPFLEAFGLDATVTPPGGAPVETQIIWVPDSRRRASDEVYEFGNELTRRDAGRKVLSVPRADVDPVELGSVIEAPEELGMPTRTWRVEGTERIMADETHVVVVPA